MTLVQTPQPGSFNIYRCGDIFHLKLIVKNFEATPYIRTSIGGAHKMRNSIICETEQELFISQNNWIDLPLFQIDHENYEISLPLSETGYFEAKIWFKQTTTDEIIWSEGDNVYIKIEPASTIANNSIYGVFTRQFGINKHKNFAQDEESIIIEELNTKGYHVIPPSGTFRDVKNELDHIMGHMGFRILQLLPIHPTPTTYARMGRFGSPYAALDFFSVDPALAVFDKQATPLDQFIELVDEVHKREGEIFLDIPVEHTGWASVLQKDHPEYFEREYNGKFLSPGAWGTTWEDLIKLNFKNTEVRQMLAQVFIYWCDKGVDGFRCDAGYMVPAKDWEYIISKVRNEYPNTIFLLEGLGGPQEVTETLLATSTFSWAYSELFQNYDKSSITYYINNMLRINNNKGGMCNFSETHDNNRLAAKSKTWAVMRNLLCALTAPAGGFGISNGVEFLAQEKISVHHANGLNWGNEDNIIELFARLTTIFKYHPAFHANASIEVIENNNDNLFFIKRTAKSGEILHIVVNLNCDAEQYLNLNSAIGINESSFDLINQNIIENSTVIPAGMALCIDGSNWHSKTQNTTDSIVLQKAKSTLLKTHIHLNGFGKIETNYLDQNLDLLLNNPFAFCLKEGATLGQIIQYNVLKDTKRTIAAGAESILLLQSEELFNFAIKADGINLDSGQSIPRNDGQYFALVPLPPNDTKSAISLNISITAVEKGKICKKYGLITLVENKPRTEVKQTFSLKECKEDGLYAFGANNSGSMFQISSIWGNYLSKYDGFFAVNMDTEVPVDRTMLLSRIRCWVVYNEYSHELGEKSQYQFAADGVSNAIWSFKVPVGQGKYILLDLKVHFSSDNDLLSIVFDRKKDPHRNDLLDENIPIKVIIRPDIEYRSNHETTKAYLGAEKLFPNSIKKDSNGFTFNPYNNIPFHLHLNSGTFTSEPEWIYLHHLPAEENRGLECTTDFFSPGYFSLSLKEEQYDILKATIDKKLQSNITSSIEIDEYADCKTVLKNTISRFIVRRNEAQTVIAGYPWFLDWGRDTLICLRGIIASGMQQEAKDILITFARYEENGTLPNMIRGNNASNRDTSDAPLWFVIAVKDYYTQFKDNSILTLDCGKRTILDVIESIVENYEKGTSNGIKMDNDSALIYSPSHYTWMDTNYPAGTPREGYPIEIQCFWQTAVSFLNIIKPNSKWELLSQKIKNSIFNYYPLEYGDGFSDCLHTNGFQPASEAVKDNACRPNQLFAITLGVIEDKHWMESIIMATQSLIIPGSIRSLKDAPVNPPLPIYNHGNLLNNPEAPYWGNYEGDEDTRRKPAYHNGTAWSWPFFSYCESLYIYNKNDKSAFAILMSAKQELQKGVVNHMPEINDGNTPHKQRGCLAQAWSITEFYRVFNKLNL